MFSENIAGPSLSYQYICETMQDIIKAALDACNNHDGHNFYRGIFVDDDAPIDTMEEEEISWMINPTNEQSSISV